MRKAFLFLLVVPVLASFGQSTELGLRPAPGTYHREVSVSPPEGSYEFRFSGDSTFRRWDRPLDLSALSGEERRYEIEIQPIEQPEERQELQYTIDRSPPAPPVTTPPPGVYRAPLTVELASEEGKILTEVRPKVSRDIEYRGPIELPGVPGIVTTYELTTLVVDDSGNSGPEERLFYVIDLSHLEEPYLEIVSPTDGTFANEQLLYVVQRGMEEVRYSLDGSDPLDGGDLYVGPVLLARTGEVQLTIAGRAFDGRIIERSVSYSSGDAVAVGTAQGYHTGALFVTPIGDRGFRYRLEDSPVSRTDANASRALELRAVPGALRPVVLRLNESPTLSEPDYRYVFLLDDRTVAPPTLLLFSPEAGSVTFALDQEPGLETEYEVSLNGRTYTSGSYEGPVTFRLPEDVLDGSGTLKARSRSGFGPWSEYATERFAFSTTSPAAISLEVDPPGPSPAKRIGFGEAPQGRIHFELRSSTEPMRPVTRLSGELRDDAVLSVPFGMSRTYALDYATVDAYGNVSETRTIELAMDHEPPQAPRLSFVENTMRLRGRGEILYRIVKDDGSVPPEFTRYTGPVTLASIPQRRVGYTVEAYAVDEVGNSSWIIQRQLFRDTRPLEVPQIVGVEDGGIYSQESVSLDLAEYPPGIDVLYTLSTDGTVPPDPMGNASILDGPVAIFGAGDEVVRVHAKLRPRNPESGRMGPVRDLRFAIDREPPVLPELQGVEAGDIYPGERRISLTPFERGASAFLIVGERRIPYREPIVLDVEDGQQRAFEVSVVIIDEAGNVTSSAFPTPFTIDREAPAPPFVELSFEGGSPTLRLSGGDGTIYYEVAAIPEAAQVPDEQSATYTGPVPLTTGRYTVAAVEIDGAGNRGVTTYSSDLVVPPPGSLSGVLPVVLAGWEEGNAVLVWPYAHLAELWYRLPGSEAAVYAEPVEFELLPGESELEIEFLVGRPETGEWRRLTLSPPDIPGIGRFVVEGPIVSKEDVRLDLSEAGGTLRYELSTVGPAPPVSRRSPKWEGSLQLVGRDGEEIRYSVAVRSFSEFGASEEVRKDVTIDRAPPPAPRLVNAGDGEFYEESRTVRLESQEGEVYYRFVRNAGPQETTQRFSPYDGEFVLEAVAGELSDYRMEAYSVDDVGNRSPATAVWNVYIDREIIYVAPGGNDRGAGTRESPFRTLERAMEYASESDRETIFLASGVYEISSPLRSIKGLAIQGRFSAESWQPGSTTESLIVPSGEFSGDALVVSYRGDVTMSRLALSSPVSFGRPLILVDDIATRLNAVSLSSLGGHAIEARKGSILLRNVTLDQSGTVSESIQLRGTSIRIESSIIRSGSFGNSLAVALDLQDSTELTMADSRIEAYGIRRGTAIAAANSSVEISGTTIRVGSSRGNAQAITARDGGVTIGRSLLEADEETQVANLIVSRDGTLAVQSSQLTLNAEQGAVGIVASGGQIDIRSCRFLGTSLNDFTYGVQARGVEGIFVNNVFQAGQSGEYIAGSLVESPSQWIHNTFLGFRSSPFVQILNLRGAGRTIFGNNLALQEASGSGSVLVVAGRHQVEMIGNIFDGWATLLDLGGRRITSVESLESGRLEGVTAQLNAVERLESSVGRDGVAYRLSGESPAIDRAVSIVGGEDVLVDIEGQRRPAPVPPAGSFRRDYRGRPDVGADEYYP